MGDRTEYLRQRRVVAAEKGLCIACYREPRSNGVSRCVKCSADEGRRAAHRRRMAGQKARDSAPNPIGRYIPIGDVLNRCGIRILRHLKWFDWATPSELYEAMNSSGDLGLHKAMNRLVCDGHVEMDGSRMDARYRVTPAGRARLKSVLDGYQASLGEMETA